MRCEICGNEIRGRPYYRIIEGGRMTVCGRCASYGSAEWTPNKPRAPPRGQPTPRRPRSEVEAAETLELVEDYGMKIRKERQRKRMTVEDLARKIGEKESVIKKLEKEELNPDRKLVRKIRNALNIDILVAGETSATPIGTRPPTGRTIGDIMKLRQSKHEEEDERG
jgi:putative transcription factor